MKKLIYFLALILCWHAGHAQTYHSVEEFAREKKSDQLLLLIQKRLVIMHEVARTKWNQGLPIEDKAREEQLLKQLAEKAKAYQLDEQWVAKFFQAQIDAAKEIQKRDFALWRQQGVTTFEKVFSLKDELRTYIDQINQEMLLLLNDQAPLVLDHPISSRPTDLIEKEIWSLAIGPLKS